MVVGGDVPLPLCLGAAASPGFLHNGFCRRSVVEIQSLCSWVGGECINHTGSFESLTLWPLAVVALSPIFLLF